MQRGPAEMLSLHFTRYPMYLATVSHGCYRSPGRWEQPVCPLSVVGPASSGASIH